jgi:hypothetical protein
MKTPRLRSLTILALALLGSATLASAAEAFRLIRVDDLAKLRADHSAPVEVYDANPSTVRERYGVIPGAHLLDSLEYEPAEVLPKAKDAKLVFYCANTH